jgi:hypothetical protein
MSLGAVSPSSPAVNNYLTSSTAPYQSSPTNSTATSLPLTQEVGGNTDHTFTASVTDHELDAVTTPNPLGTATAPTLANNAQPDTLAQSGVGLHVSASQ